MIHFRLLGTVATVVILWIAGAVAVQAKSQAPKLAHEQSESEAEKKYLITTMGEDRIVDLEFDANATTNGISIGNPKVVATTLVKLGDKRQIVFKPLSNGETNVTVRDAEGFVRLIFHVTVTVAHLAKISWELRELLKDIEGVEIKILGKKVILDGELLTPNDYGRVLNIITDKSYSDTILNLTTLSPVAMQLLSRRIQKDINAFAQAVTTRVVNGQIWLEGSVDNLEQARRAAKVAELYLPELKPGHPLEKDPSVQRLPPRGLVQNFIVVNPPPPKKQDKLVRVTFNFVELAKDYQKAFGFKWQPGFTSDPTVTIGSTTAGAAGASGTGAASFTATLSSLFPKLSSAQDAGFARILKTGTVIVRSGKPAVLSDETQIPYAVIGPNREVATNTANVGLNVSVTPAVLGQSDDIEMDIDLNQVNQTGVTKSEAPITSSHKVKTKLYVKSSESAAIAGVSFADVKTNFNKDPDLGAFGQNQNGQQTSALFTLLRSKAYNKRKSDFVIFVTPQIIENASDGTDDLKKNFRVRVK